MNMLTASPHWPTLSVVIPIHGGRDDLAACLSALAPLHAERLIGAVTVVDNAFPDNAGREESARFPFVTLLQNDTNTGFAHASNQGAASPAVGAEDHLLFLNSDAVLTRAGLIRMVESLLRSWSIGATGLYTNYAGHD